MSYFHQNLPAVLSAPAPPGGLHEMLAAVHLYKDLKFVVFRVPQVTLISKYEVFMAVMLRVEVSWVLTPCSFVVGYQCFGRPYRLILHLLLHPDYAGSMAVRNVGKLPQHYTALKPRRLRLDIRLVFETNS
jgi:hypothetical protein